MNVEFVSGASGGDQISNYEYSIDGGATWITLNPASIVSPLVISGLTNGIDYPVQIRTVNSVGASSASATATLKPHAVTSCLLYSPSVAAELQSGVPDALHSPITSVTTKHSCCNSRQQTHHK